MLPGALIDYPLCIRWFPVRWQSEITVWKPPHRFVDVGAPLDRMPGSMTLAQEGGVAGLCEAGLRMLSGLSFQTLPGAFLHIRQDVFLRNA